jgi:Lar family restriction alleviation protein
MAAEQNIDAERATPELKPCPFCGSANIARHTFPEDDSRDFVMCSDCGVYAQRNDCDAEPVEVWNRRSAATGESKPVEFDGIKTPEFEGIKAAAPIGEDGLPGLPEPLRFAQWTGGEELAYTADQMREVRCQAYLCGVEDGKKQAVPQAAQGVKTWQERAGIDPDAGPLGTWGAAMAEEIADLRAQLARQSQEPVAWFEAEPSARGRPLKEVINSFIYSTRIHTKAAPVTSNPVWPLYAAPPLSSEQQVKAPSEPEVRPCDMPACSGVSRETGSRPYCPEHRADFEEWRRERVRKQQAEEGESHADQT